MFSLLNRIFDRIRNSKNFQFVEFDWDNEVVPNRWHRMTYWDSQHYLKMMPEWDEDWESFSGEEKVVGITFEDRYTSFILMGDQPDFRVFLQRESNNPHDKNAIKVMGSATIHGSPTVKQLGYLSKKTARRLKNESELDARPYSVSLPHGEYRYSLKIWILVRTQTYKEKNGLASSSETNKGGGVKRNIRRVMFNDVYDCFDDARKDYDCKKVPKKIFRKVFDEFFDEMLEEQEISEEQLKTENITYVYSLCDDLIDLLEDIADRLFEIEPGLEKRV